MASEKATREIDAIIESMRKSMGLTLYEAKLYIALLLGARNPKEASIKSGVPLPRIYDVVKVLEAKGFVEREPGGWYRPYAPRAVAAAALARVEEEARTRARMILEVADMLERLSSKEVVEPESMYVVGVYKIAAAAASIAEAGGPVYIGVAPVLGKSGLAPVIVKSIMPIADVRVIVDRSIDRGLVEALEEVGARYRIASLPLDFVAARLGALLILEHGDTVIGVRVKSRAQAEHLYNVAESLFKEGSAPGVASSIG